MPQAEIIYELSGMIEDTARNRAQLHLRFQGNPRPDTIPPWIRSISPAPSSVIGRRTAKLVFGFSEPMDTTSRLRYWPIPGSVALDTAPSWRQSLDGFASL
jgi:hypothetical protein